MATNSASTKKKDDPKKKPSPSLPVQASFVFVDSLNHPIKGLTVKIDSSEQMKSETISASPDSTSAQSSPSLPYVGTTDDDGHAVTLSTVKRGQKISIFVKKRNGNFDFKGEVTPKRDINAYTIKSPEFHLESTTKLTPKEALEEELNIPKIKVGEIMTVERLFGELAPYIGAVQVVTEVGSITKDFPTKKATIQANEKTGKQEKKIEIEHHYKVVKTDKPRTIAMNVLGSRLNYPKNLEISEEQFKDMALEFDCEIAAIKAVTFTETGGSSFFENGLPKILFERHKFYFFTLPSKGEHPYAKFPDVCHPKAGEHGAPGIHQYERLLKAAKLNRVAALKSCSWGAFQVLAEYYISCGYSSAEDLANDCMVSVDAHVKLFLTFMKKEKRHAIKALKEKKWEDFTYAYNGKNWKEQNPTYPTKMAEFYEKFK